MRSDDEKTIRYIKALNHDQTKTAVSCERSFLATLDGSCKTPIAGQAKIDNGIIYLKGLVCNPEGTKMFRAERYGPLPNLSFIPSALPIPMVSHKSHVLTTLLRVPNLYVKAHLTPTRRVAEDIISFLSSGPVADFMKMGKECGDDIRAQAGEQFFVDLQKYVQNIQAANTKPVRA